MDPASAHLGLCSSSLRVFFCGGRPLTLTGLYLPSSYDGLGRITPILVGVHNKHAKQTTLYWAVRKFLLNLLGVIPRAHARYLAHPKLLFPVRVRTVNNGPKMISSVRAHGP